MADKKREVEKLFSTKNYKSIIVIGVKSNGDKNIIEPYIAGNPQELIKGIITVMEQMPVFKQMITEALITSTMVNDIDGTVN